MSTDNKGSKIELCLNWWLERLLALADFAPNRAAICYSEEDLKAIFSLNVIRPYAGVVYNNTVAQPDTGDSHRVGNSAILNVTIVGCFDAKIPGEDRPLIRQVATMRAVRSLALDQRSPTTHFWRFIAELPMGQNNQGVTVWAQRWSTPIQLTRVNPC